MKTSIFDMNFVLPPLVEMTEVEKEMPPIIVHSFRGEGDVC